MFKGSFARVVPAAAAAVVAGVVSVAPAALPVCPTPTLSAPAYVAGDANTVSWTVDGGAGGFILEVAASPARDVDGSLLDVEQSIGDLKADARSYTFAALAEGTHWYSIRAKTKPQTCSASAWSTVDVATIQDQTAPVLEITSPGNGHIFLLEPFTISGTLTDAGSGPDEVTVSAVNTTPAVGETLGAPEAVTVDASSGTWTATFGWALPGTYVVSAQGIDKVGHLSNVENLSVVFVGVGDPEARCSGAGQCGAGNGP